MDSSDSSQVPIFGSIERVPDRVGPLFKISASRSTSLLLERQSTVSTILQENPALVAYYAGIDIDQDTDDADQHDLIRRLRQNEQSRLRRRGIHPTQVSAEVRLSMLGDTVPSLALDSDVMRGSFGEELEGVRRLENYSAYQNVELLSIGELNIPPREVAPTWLWAVFRYKAIYQSDNVSPHDRFLHLAVSSVGNALTCVLYNYSFLQPEQPAFSGFSFFLFEWRYSILRVLKGRPLIPSEGDPGDPYWAESERELRTISPPTINRFLDARFANQDSNPLESLFGLTPSPDPEYSPPQTEAKALAEAYYPDLRNRQRYTVQHEVSHGIEHTVARDMRLDLNY